MHSVRTTSRLTPAARPSHASGFGAVGSTSGPSAAPGKHEQEDGYHRRGDGGGQQRDGIHEDWQTPHAGRVTTDEAVDRPDGRSLGSVRQRLAELSREHWTLVGILGARARRARLACVPALLRRRRPALPLGSDAHHPARHVPGGRTVLRVSPRTTRRRSTSCSLGWRRSRAWTSRAPRQLLGIIWLPVIPLGAYLLARRLSGRGDVALVAAVLTAFAGGLDLSNDRLWVNSMFLVGHVAFPIYPRDLVFGILPFATLAYLRATDGEPALARLVARLGRAAWPVRADPAPAPDPDPARVRRPRRRRAPGAIAIGGVGSWRRCS